MPPKHSSRFFENRACEYYPCHSLEEGRALNCLFCYCPLYPYRGDCGGDCEILPSGIKDCSPCLFPHRKENYDALMARLKGLEE